MKRTILILALLAMPDALCGQEIELPLAGKLDLSRIVQSARANFVIDHRGEKHAGAHIPLASFNSTKTGELLNLNAGVIYNVDNGVGGPFAAIGMRADNILKRLSLVSWIKSRISVITLPPMELGPFGGYLNKSGWLYGGFVAISFGSPSVNPAPGGNP